MRIRVCDDVEEKANDWVVDIKEVVPSEWDLERMPDAKDQVSKLLERKRRVEDGVSPLEVETSFDEVDILVVDYDLLHLDAQAGRTTGEGIARLARSFSKCGAIVVMNQYKGNEFDLAMRGHLDSHADLNVDANLIGTPSLWSLQKPEAGKFNPTTWAPVPEILQAAVELADRFEKVQLDAPLMPQIGLGQEALSRISDTAFGFLSQKIETADILETSTVRDFLDRSLDGGTVETLKQKAPYLLYRFAAFRIIKWLDRAVLRPMDVLIDTLHLVDRMPFLLKPDSIDVKDPSDWNKAANDPQRCLRWDVLEAFVNENASLTMRKPIFDWFRISNDGKFEDLQDAYLESEDPRFQLAEDTSRFVAHDAVKTFRADFHNFNDRRAIEQLETITYGPLRRLRFG